MADKEGTYTIPGATIVADGQNKTSNSVQIKVLPPDQTNGVGGGNNSGGRTSSRSQVAGSKITNQDNFQGNHKGTDQGQHLPVIEVNT